MTDNDSGGPTPGEEGKAPGAETIGRAHEAWSSRAIYIIAAIGATVGLGNMWRFPYAAGSNGGGAFVAVYIIAVFILAAPLFMAETLIGRVGRRSAPNSLKAIARTEGFPEAIKYWGWLCLLTTVLVLSFFSVLAGFSLEYALRALGGLMGGAGLGTPDQVGASFGAFLGDSPRVAMWHTIIAVATALIVGFGIRGGLEKAAKYLMPALLVVLLFLVGYALVEGDAAQTFDWLFGFHWSDLTAGVALAAVGQAFFTMSVGSGGMLTYGAYVDKPIAIGRSTMVIALGDTVVAILAGLAIFPIVFANELDPADGATLVFVTLPVAFAGMAFGNLVGLAFFVLFVFAAITTSIAMLETIVSYLEERRPPTRWGRMRSAFTAMGLVWAVGFVIVLSFGDWSAFYPLSFIPGLEEKNPFGLFDFTVTNLFLPLTGIAFSLIAGWVISKQTSITELGLGDGRLYAAWRFIVRWMAPVVVLALLVLGLA